MAQWNGQFTGNTHQTKVEDLEESLREAITIFRQSISDEEKQTKGKAIRKLAKKLFAARLKLLKAKIYDLEPVVEEKHSKRIKQIESLRQQETKISGEGVDGILIEFNAKDLIHS